MLLKLNATQTESFIRIFNNIMGNIIANIVANIVGSIIEYFMGNSIPRNVKIETVTIHPNTTNEDSQFVVATNALRSGHTAAPVEEAFSSPLRTNFSTELAAKLVVSNEQEENDVKKYHEACVKVISANKQGSGVVFQISKATQTRIMLVTAAHVIPDKSNVKVVLEVNYTANKERKTFEATEHTIKLENQQSEIDEAADIAMFFLCSHDSKYILQTVRKFPLPSLALDDHSSERFTLIHHAGGEYKKVSAGERETPPIGQSLKTVIQIQGGEGASGAPLFNFQGDVVAILGSHDTKNPQRRYFKSLNFFHHYRTRDALQNLFESTEGKKYEKTFCHYCDLLEKRKKERRINRVDVKLDAKCLTMLKCLRVGGEHGDTRQYSKSGKIESDHFPPYSALKKASEMKDCCTPVQNFFLKHSSKKSRRCGENFLPAITIPKIFHRKHDSTGSRRESEIFREDQAKKIAADTVSEAIIMHFSDYEKKGLFKRCNYDCRNRTFKKLMKKYREGFTAALKVHKELRFIEDIDVKRLEEVVIDLTGRNETDDGLSLEPDRIKVKDDEDLVKDVEDLRIGC